MLSFFLAGCTDESTVFPPEDDPSAIDDYEPATIDPGNIDQLVNLSAPRVFATGMMFFFVAGFEDEASTCPKVTETSSQTVIEGGCTDADGRSWYGKAVSDETGVTYQGFGFVGEQDCGDGQTGSSEVTLEGKASMDGPGSETISFSVDLEVTGTAPQSDTCETFTASGLIDYAGTVKTPSGSIDGGVPSTWNGSGRFGYDGVGRLEAQTIDEVLDDSICSEEATSGKTIVRSDSGDEAVISYDGATDCDPEGTATWTLNGVDQGEISGVSCAAGGRGSRGALGIFGLLAGVALLRRRR